MKPTYEELLRRVEALEAEVARLRVEPQHHYHHIVPSYYQAATISESASPMPRMPNIWCNGFGGPQS